MALNSPNPAAIVVKGLMDEANQDGKQYARQDGEWSEVAPAAGKNILINGNLTIDQRGKSQFGHALPTDDFVWDRWMLVANGSPQIYQIVEEGNYEPNTVYTLSWDGAEPQQATSPASGHWNIKNSFPVLPQWSSKKIQLEKGDTATEFEWEDIGTTLLKCQRYYEKGSASAYGYALAGNSTSTVINYAAAKRELPSLNLSEFENVLNCSKQYASGAKPDPSSHHHCFEAISTGNFGGSGTWTADAEIPV